MAETTADQEAAWIRQVAEGSREAFEQIFHAYKPRLFRYLFRLTADPAASEELLSDVIVAVWKGAKTYRGEAKPSTWIFGIAHHKAINLLRKRRPEMVELEDNDLQELEDTQQARPEDLIIQKELKEKIEQALLRLSVSHRAVIEMTFYQGFSCQEIAEILGCPVSTVKTRMFYARRQLQGILGKWGEGTPKGGIR
ncbi:MAG: RNA polymerase sigma factor [Nitrospirota bacterium]